MPLLNLSSAGRGHMWLEAQGYIQIDILTLRLTAVRNLGRISRIESVSSDEFLGTPNWD